MARTTKGLIGSIGDSWKEIGQGRKERLNWKELKKKKRKQKKVKQKSGMKKTNQETCGTLTMNCRKGFSEQEFLRGECCHELS